MRGRLWTGASICMLGACAYKHYQNKTYWACSKLRYLNQCKDEMELETAFAFRRMNPYGYSYCLATIHATSDRIRAWQNHPSVVYKFFKPLPRIPYIVQDLDQEIVAWSQHEKMNKSKI